MNPSTPFPPSRGLPPPGPTLAHIHESLEACLAVPPLALLRGKVLEVVGTIIRATAPAFRIGEICMLRNRREKWEVPAEVVGFTRDCALLTPLGRTAGLSPDMEVVPSGALPKVGVGNGLLGRVLDGFGQPMDALEKGPLIPEEQYPLYQDPPAPLERGLVSRPFWVGIKSIDSLLTCGEGQRVGVFAAAGGGKSTLLSMLVKGASADVCVVALIGERGREVREFVERHLGEEARKRCVIVVATSDRPSMERLKAAYVATAIAEYFRDCGKNVLLLMDSVTRFARALREVGLAAGEPPTRRGYPPSVFSSLPLLLERAGPGRNGSITAFYTVLVEGDDMSEPIADETRSILDGHIVLSRKLAAANHYPAVDVLASVSRVMSAIVQPDHRQAAGKMRSLMAKYQEIELLVQIGEFQKGADPEADAAVERWARIRKFLQQSEHEVAPADTLLDELKTIVR